MRTHDLKLNAALGFLTVIEDRSCGLFGGYLVLNPAGRPLEFHCTAPIKPNRAQEILYGPTLEPYLFGDQIGRTLLSKGQAEPRVVCTDCAPVLSVRQYVDVPVVLVLPRERVTDPDAAVSDDQQPDGLQRNVWRLDAAHDCGDGLSAFGLGRNRLAVPDGGVDNPQRILDRLGELPDWFDLAEPFQRIREAIEEARRGG